MKPYFPDNMDIYIGFLIPDKVFGNYVERYKRSCSLKGKDGKKLYIPATNRVGLLKSRKVTWENYELKHKYDTFLSSKWHA